MSGYRKKRGTSDKKVRNFKKKTSELWTRNIGILNAGIWEDKGEDMAETAKKRGKGGRGMAESEPIGADNA